MKVRATIIVEYDPQDIPNLRAALVDVRGYTREGAALEVALHDAPSVEVSTVRGTTLTPDDAVAAVRRYGSQARAAKALGIPRTTFRAVLSGALLEGGKIH